MSAEFLTIRECASIMRVKPGTLYQWLRRKVDIPHLKVQGTVLIPKDRFERWCEARTQHKRIKSYEE